MLVTMDTHLVSIGEDLLQQIPLICYLVYQYKERSFCTMARKTLKNLRRHSGWAIIKSNRDSSSMLAN
jgi:hypothetical protein